MIVLDTNVVSEAMRRDPDPAVLRWLDEQDGSETALSVVTAAELRAGVAVLPEGRRRMDLHERVETVLTGTFHDRIFAFGEDATPAYADIVATRRRSGRPISVQDAQIAAVCRSEGASLATRNTADFDGTGVDLINPWEL